MKFERLNIYSRHNGDFSGNLEISEEAGKVELKLNDTQIREIISICADSIVNIAESAANDMKTQVYESMKKLKDTE